MRNSPADPKVRTEEEAMVLHMPEQRFSCTLWRTMVKQVSPHRTQREPCQSRWIFPERRCSSWRTFAGVGSPDSNSVCWRDHSGSGLSWRTITCGDHPGKSSSWRVSAMGKVPTGVGEKCEEEEATEKNSHRWTATYSPSPLYCSACREMEESGTKEWSWDWEKRQSERKVF